MAYDPRQEFPGKVKRAALKRSGGRCEAKGPVYGKKEGKRCTALFTVAGTGMQFDHRWGARNRMNDVDDCRVVCTACHRFKTGKVDTPREAKNKRIHDKALGYRHTRNPMRKAKSDMVTTYCPTCEREWRRPESRSHECPRCGTSLVPAMEAAR